MAKVNHPQTSQEQDELEQLRREVRLLKAQLKGQSAELEHQTLGHEAYKLLVELAEETYGIEILKNSEAK